MDMVIELLLMTAVPCRSHMMMVVPGLEHQTMSEDKSLYRIQRLYYGTLDGPASIPFDGNVIGRYWIEMDCVLLDTP
jgi:hypothetical protein